MINCLFFSTGQDTRGRLAQQINSQPFDCAQLYFSMPGVELIIDCTHTSVILIPSVLASAQ